MMKTTMIRLQAGLLLSTCLFSYQLVAQAQCDKPVGHFASLQSSVDLQRNDSSEWNAAKISDHLCEGDTIRVGKKSRAAIQLANDAVLRLDQNTTMRLLSVTKDPKKRSFLQVIKGVFQSFTRKPHHLSVQTPYLNGLIEGTEFLVKVDADQSSILLLEGKIVAKNDKGTVTIMPGQAAVAAKGEAPKTVLVAKPLDAVQWTLHYPALLKLNTAEYSDSGWQGAVKQSIAADKAGDLKMAFSSIAGMDNVKDARFYNYRASLLLTVGRVDDARKDLEHALSLSPKDSNALALQAIIAVAQNEQDKALASATQATQAAPESATALIALSYAQQSKFDLDGAKASLEKAVKLEPKNALAWARLAEIYSSFRELDLSLAAAQKAVAIDPNLSRTQTVLGFIDLTRVDTKGATTAFDKAVKLDQTDPLPRLGLGLAKIAEGDLHGGQRELDLAAILDPNKAIIRSYLGKAYYEEKRNDLAAQQFDIAKRLDPKDPTPWFYDAIAKQTQNQPVEALHSMDQAIALNDNRAVYRSKLLLDSDLAARSASQARIYSDLGFQQLALVDGWQSANTDPTNYSAHRFLADSYSALPNHEIARVSELLQSQLLQPLSLSPVQPQSAESNLFLINSSGASSVGFNEYNPLFYQNGTAGQVSLMSAGNSTTSAEAVFSGVSGKVAYSFGGYQFQTDGFRPNAYQNVDLANAFVQMEVSPSTSIQAEYRYKNAERGDVQLKFFPDEYNIGEKIPEFSHSLRLGAKHDFSPNSTLLASVAYIDGHFGATQDPSTYLSNLSTIFNGYPTLFSLIGDEPQKQLSEEFQYLYRATSYNITGGVGHYNRHSTATTTSVLAVDPTSSGTYITLPPSVGPTDDTSLDHANAYIYSNIHATDNLTLTLGLSSEFTSNPDGSVSRSANDSNQYNPKFGVTWKPAKDTLVRIAAFRAVKRPIIANQTLEPTQVAGFNQFYDDINNTIAHQYGAAIDQTFSKNLFGGLEVSRRNLDVPTQDSSSAYVNTDWLDETQRAYLFWTPTSWLGLKLDYQFEHIDHNELLTEGIKQLDTHKLQLGLKIFDPSGWSFSLNPTYYDQSGTFESFTQVDLTNPPSFLAERDGKDHFWIVDAAVSYRLPKRHGFISAGVKNMFKKEFMYFDTDYKNPTLQPGRTVFVNATIVLP